MGKNYLIDSNTLLEFVAGILPTNAQSFVENIVNQNFNVSVINRIEVLGHESATPKLKDFMDLANTFQLTQDVENQTIEIRKQKKIKLPDAIIASTALVHKFIIVSRNTKDFQNIEGLEYVNPYDIV